MIKKYLEFLKESKKYKLETPNGDNVVRDICVSMVLLNPEFLDNVLDRGIRSRYTENSHAFITDLKNLILAKNRLKIGRFVEDNKCVEDEDFSQLSELFDHIEFSVESDWKVLIDSRNIARSIMDKLLVNKLEPTQIGYVYWNLRKDSDHKEDLVLELEDGLQYSLFLNKNITTQKTASFNTFADDLIGADIDKLFKDDYIGRWNELTQKWINIIYENANKDIQQLIEKFIDTSRVESIGYFEYFDILHKDPKFKHLGEFIKEFNKNILKFSDLMSEIWKNRETCFMDPVRVSDEWYEAKIVLLNSKILENLITTSLKSNHVDDIKKVENGWKLAGGTVKMKLFKTLVEKIGCIERPVYFIAKNGEVFNMIPSRQFFRDFYDDITIKFDYHVNFEVSEEEEDNDFNIKIKFEMDGKDLIDMFIIVKFSGSEMSGKLSAKYKFDIVDDFNFIISKKQSGDDDKED